MENREVTVVRDEDRIVFGGEEELFVIMCANEMFIAGSRHIMTHGVQKRGNMH